MEDRAWASFALHAGQRLTTFNFIVLSSLLVNALVVSLQRDFRVPYVGVMIGLLLAALAFTFWKIDVLRVPHTSIAGMKPGSWSSLAISGALISRQSASADGNISAAAHENRCHPIL